MKATNEATISELNKVVGALLDSKDGEQQVIDALNNAMGMTYSQLAEIYTQAGKELTENMVESMQNNGILKALGGNKVMIADFERFASQMGWKADSEEYFNALRTYRNGIVEYDKRIGTEIKNEFDAVTSAKRGDKIDISRTLQQYGKQIFEGLDVVIKDGMLEITDAAQLSQIAIRIGEAATNAGGMLDEELQDFIASIHDNILNGITNAFGYHTNGTNSIASMQTFINEYNTLTGENLDYADAFGYDTLFNTFKLSDRIMKKYIAAQRQQLEALGLSDEAIDEYIKDQTVNTLKQNFDISNFINASTKQLKAEEAAKLVRQIQDIASAEGGYISEAIAFDWVQMIEKGGDDAVAALTQIKGKENLSLDEIQNAYLHRINALNDILSDVDKLTTGQYVGTEGKLAEVLNRAKAIDGSGVVKQSFSMVEVYAAIYAEMETTAGRLMLI